MGEQTGSPSSGRPALAPRIALLVLLLGLAVGAALGWTSGERTYRADGLIYIAPHAPVPAGAPGEDVLPRFSAYVAFQTQLLKSARLASLALVSDAWKEDGAKGMDAAAFIERRRIMHKTGTQHIRVAFLNTEPEIALAGVQALLAAYQQLAADLDPSRERIEYARTQIEVLQGKLKKVQDQILALTNAYGGVEGLEIRHAHALKQVLELEDQIVALRKLIEQGGDGKTSIEELKAREKALVAHLEVLRAQNRKLGQARADVERLKAQATELKKKLEELTLPKKKLEQLSLLKKELEKQMSGTGRIRIPDPGSLPTEPFEDSRLLCAARYAAIGALPGFLLMLFVGLSGMRATRRRD